MSNYKPTQKIVGFVKIKYGFGADKQAIIRENLIALLQGRHYEKQN